MLQSGSTEVSVPAQVSMPRDIRALLLDDSNFDRARIRRLSQKTGLSIHLDEVDSIDAMDRAVAQANYDLILIDYRLPVGDGLMALDHIQRNDLNRDAGKIMITGNGAVDTAVQAMRGGCHDFLSKDNINETVLHEAIMNAMAAAHQRRTMEIQLVQNQDIMKAGLIRALNDDELRENVVTMFRQEFEAMAAMNRLGLSDLSRSEIDALLVGFNEEDEFIFH